MKNKKWLFPGIMLSVLIGFSIDAFSQSGDVINIGKQRQLFADDFIIEKIAGKAALVLHHPEMKEIVMVFDEPWEGSYSNYNSIFKDGDIYRMYYRGWNRKPDGGLSHDMVWCYAESKDGIHWEKPNLGLFEFNGSKENNIVIASRDFDDFHFSLKDNITVFKDQNPNVSPDAVYKAFVDARKQKPDWSLLAFKSSDGIHWLPMTGSTPVLTMAVGSFDSQNTAFWDSLKNEYRAYWRFFGKDSVRSIRTGTSKDFIHWKVQSDLQYTDTIIQQLYTNGIVPYYRAPQIFIGFPARYIDRGWSESMEALPQLKERRGRSFTNPRYGTALTESIFIVSHDAVKFKRWNEAFLRPGIERNGTWNYGQQYIAWSFLETKSDLEGAPNEISFYANENLWTGKGSQLRRYTIRLDGFVSVSAPMAGGSLVTKPIVFNGNKLSINFSTSALGSVRVEIQDISGKPLPGFSLKDCPPIFGDAVNRTVFWNNGSDLSSLAGKIIRLKFVMSDADLYSFCFHE